MYEPMSASHGEEASEEATQAFALLWKRAWCASSADAKGSLFNTLSAAVQSSNLSRGQAAIVLRAVVEEFSGKSSAEIGAPIQFHRSSYAAFEGSGLDETFQPAIDSAAVQNEINGCKELLHTIFRVSHQAFYGLLTW
jgi:hypothetical protein